MSGFIFGNVADWLFGEQGKGCMSGAQKVQKHHFYQKRMAFLKASLLRNKVEIDLLHRTHLLFEQYSSKGSKRYRHPNIHMNCSRFVIKI